MTVDSYFAIGKTHLVCQDYAYHDTGKLPFGLVADGCSSSPHTDFGARFLVLGGVERLTLWGDCLKSEWVIRRAAEAVEETMLPAQCLDSTLGAVFQTLEGKVRAVMTGDGVIIARRRGSGVVEHIDIEFNEGAPGYLSYQLDPKRWQGYINQGLGVRTVARYLSGWMELTETDTVDKSNLFDFTVDYDPVDYDLVMVASDGLKSFQHRVGNSYEPIPLCLVVPHLTNIKGFTGQYLVRRMRRFLTKWCPANGWHHNDDVSVAALHIPEATNDVSNQAP